MTRYRSFIGARLYLMAWAFFGLMGLIRSVEVMLPVFAAGLLFFITLGVLGMRGGVDDPNGLYRRVLTGGAWIALAAAVLMLAWYFVSSNT